MSTPLAVRRRPRRLSDIQGQDHLVAPGKVLAHAISSGQLFSMILWGPPGCGKTTLAEVIAASVEANFIRVNAVASGIADLKKAIEEARSLRSSLFAKSTILFIDEIHRFNKAQQDYLLPYVEQGDVTLIGATTENPSFEVISALLSRCKVLTLNVLSAEDINAILTHTMAEEADLADLQDRILPEHLTILAKAAFGDARYALNSLEALANYVRGSQSVPTTDLLKQVLDNKALLYDKDGEEHYNLISALHKCLRDSDPDAAVYWLARMLEAGEDPKYVVRRLIRFASEDIGLADPRALTLAIAAKETVLFVGWPECNTALTELVIFLAQAPKNNDCYMVYNQAKADVKEFGPLPVPLVLRNAPTSLMRDLGYGEGYKYAHDYAGAQVEQEHWPAELRQRQYLKKKKV